jgi:hypothetical protein
MRRKSVQGHWCCDGGSGDGGSWEAAAEVGQVKRRGGPGDVAPEGRQVLAAGRPGWRELSGRRGARWRKEVSQPHDSAEGRTGP